MRVIVMAHASRTAQMPVRDAKAFQKAEPMHEQVRPSLWRRALNKAKSAAAAIAAVALIAAAAPKHLDAQEESAFSARTRQALQLLNETRLVGYSTYPSRWDYGTLSQSRYGLAIIPHMSLLQENMHSVFYPSYSILMEFGVGLALNIEPVTIGSVVIISPFYEEGVCPSSAHSAGGPYTRNGSIVDFGAFIAADLYDSAHVKMVLQAGITTLSNPYATEGHLQVPKEFSPYIGLTVEF
ncbi:MAG: hypothetical protein QXU54_03490 [Candidatus Micrarchaeia archaeon]